MVFEELDMSEFIEKVYSWKIGKLNFQEKNF